MLGVLATIVIGAKSLVESKPGLAYRLCATAFTPSRPKMIV